MSFVADFKPGILWKHFDRILTIPRGSKNEGAMRQYILDISDSTDELSVQRIIELIRGCKIRQTGISSVIRKRVQELAQRNRVNYYAILESLPKADIV